MCNLVNIPMSIFPEVKPTRYVLILSFAICLSMIFTQSEQSSVCNSRVAMKPWLLIVDSKGSDQIRDTGCFSVQSEKKMNTG